MRLALALAVLASACDQGANAAPPKPADRGSALEIAKPPAPRFVIVSDADFTTKALAVLGELGELFADGSKDCELVATRVETYAAQNVTRFSILMAYGKAHPDAEKLLQSQFKPQTDLLVQRLMPTVSACASNQRLMQSFQKLSDSAQLQQQRPR